MNSHPDLDGPGGIELLIEPLDRDRADGRSCACCWIEMRFAAPEGLGIFSYPGKPHANGMQWAYQFPAYPWLNFCQYVASGQYDRAEASLEVISELFERNEAALTSRYTAFLAAQAAAEVAIAMQTRSLFNRLIVAQLVEGHRERFLHARTLSVRRADLNALAGILELERGRAREGEERPWSRRNCSRTFVRSRHRYLAWRS